ncbi:MAG: hypothetical protein GEV28_22130 [Actinophytocola sp.]|uniref:hypothetical protein n=1 Tax=Actinophytocola sp. TaxID=1872138 RepID=UPI001323651C|nr:hypothetical protein [Actinophytocola sp.]MPZ82946.1 hypothetical protein [Actinophytocola sp.]
MGWIKARREAKRVEATKFGLLWTASLQCLDSLGAAWEEARGTRQAWPILFEYARYGTECWHSIVQHRVPGDPNLDFDGGGLTFYFPKEFPDGQIFQWADRVRVDRQRVVGLVLAHTELCRDVSAGLDHQTIGQYVDHLESYAGWAHLTLRQVLPV